MAETQYIDSADMQDNLARLRHLLDVTRRGVQITMGLTVFLGFAFVVFAWLLVSECLFNQCGIFMAGTIGVSLFFITINFLLCAKAALIYCNMHRDHKKQYEAIQDVVSFLRMMQK